VPDKNILVKHGSNSGEGLCRAVGSSKINLNIKEYGGMPLLHGPVENLHATLATMFERIVTNFHIPPTDISVESEYI
jgi:hypothetical protein